MRDKLLMARLLVAGERGATESALYKDLTPVFARALGPGRAKDAIGQVLQKATEDGLVSRGSGENNPKWGLTQKGRALAQRLFPQSEKKTWAQLKKTWLVVHALGLESRVKPADVQVFSRVTALRLVLIARELGLKLPVVPAGKAFDAALAWHVMRGGLTDAVHEWAKGRELTLGVVLSALAASVGGVSPSPKKEDVYARLAAKLVGARNAKELHDAILMRLVQDASQPVDAPAAAPAPGEESEREPAEARAVAPSPGDENDGEPTDASTFARRVITAARRSPTGKLDESLILINHAYARYVDENPADALSLAAFKQRLAAAARQGALTLASADMPQILDPDDYSASRIERGATVFALIRI